MADEEDIDNPQLNDIFFQYPLIGSNTNIPGDYTVQRRKDGINATEMLNYMFKKQFGIANAYPYLKYNYDVRQRTTAINNSTLDKQYSQKIPLEPPNDNILDNNFDSSIYGDNNGARYISSKYPYMVFYANMPMTYLDANSFFVGYVNDDLAETFYLTQNAVSPFYGNDPNFDNTYLKALIVRDSLNNKLPFGIPGSGDWLLDCDSGILTFYDNASNVTTTTPPRISFWRYEGLIGNNTIMEVKDF
jgi:hypothetical protein